MFSVRRTTLARRPSASVTRVVRYYIRKPEHNNNDDDNDNYCIKLQAIYIDVCVYTTLTAGDFVTRPMGNYRFRHGSSTDYYHNNDKSVCVCFVFCLPRKTATVESGNEHVRRRSDVAGPPSYINIDSQYRIKRCGRPLRSPQYIYI